MIWLVAFVIQVLLAVIQIPGMMSGYWFSWAAFIFCMALAGWSLGQSVRSRY